MPGLEFDFNNMFSFNIGPSHGVTEKELEGAVKSVKKAHSHLMSLMDEPDNRINLGLEWTRLPFQDKKIIRKIQRLGKEMSDRYENVIFLGIGGSYLGLKAAQDALSFPYHNESAFIRGKVPRIYFEGNNLDPEPLSALMKMLEPKKTAIVVISKSGETTETKASFKAVENWLKKGAGAKYGRQIFVITDPASGGLRERVNEEQKKDALSFRSLALLRGVGGRFSELNMGLLHLAVIGVDIDKVLEGARAMLERCRPGSLCKNPAWMYAVLHNVLYRKKGKSISIMMPFSETLKSTADWHVQLLAESLGKKYKRKIRIDDSGMEVWENDKTRAINAGRTPISSRGTNDLHSIQQNNIEGENNKVITFIRISKFKNDIKIPGPNNPNGFLEGMTFSELITLAHEATEWALVREKRPNCAIIMPEVTPYYWGGLIFFFEMATAFEGELLDVNAFDQPGVNSYKNYMYYRLHRKGIDRAIADEIKRHPLVKKKDFII